MPFDTIMAYTLAQSRGAGEGVSEGLAETSLCRVESRCHYGQRKEHDLEEKNVFVILYDRLGWYAQLLNVEQL